MNESPILLFDGVCNLCNRFVQFVIRYDYRRRFKFASLQSEAGQLLLRKFNLPEHDFGSFVLIEQENYYLKSTAALHVLRGLGGIGRLFYGFIILPKSLRDFIYDLVARSRYRLFGKRNECIVPTPDLQERFL